MSTCRHLSGAPDACVFCKLERAEKDALRKDARPRYRKGALKESEIRTLEVQLRSTRAALRRVWKRASRVLEGT